MDVLVVAAADDGALAVLRHDEGQRGGVDLSRMDRDPYFALMSWNMRPSQSLAMVAIRSGTMPSFAQQNAAVTALPPNETA